MLGRDADFEQLQLVARRAFGERRPWLATQRVLASREFDETITAASEDAYGGVVAANRAVQIAMEKLANFCAEIAVAWQPPAR